jgi:pre-mRNA-splicing factor SYF1
VFDAYAKFEEQIVNVTMASMEEDNEPDASNIFEQKIEKLVNETFKRTEAPSYDEEFYRVSGELNNDEDFVIYRLKSLLERRPFLLSHVVLRQNPNNVYEWLNLAKMCDFDDMLALKTYTEAILQIDPQNAYGKLSKLWISFAEYYELRDDLENANLIFHRATNVNYNSLDELSAIWCSWAEMHLRHRNYEAAREILKEACSRKPVKDKSRALSPSMSYVIWQFYVDIETEMGSFQNVKGIYQKMIDHQLATPQTILNYGAFLESAGYFEEAFRVYEKAINSFQWPYVYDIWVVYLAKFTERYGGNKLERLRDLFEQVIKSCPQEKLKFFYYMYADIEENFGLYNRVIDIYDRALQQLGKDDRLQVLKIAIAKTAKFFGLSKTRKIYQVIVLCYSRKPLKYCSRESCLSLDLSTQGWRRT